MKKFRAMFRWKRVLIAAAVLAIVVGVWSYRRRQHELQLVGRWVSQRADSLPVGLALSADGTALGQFVKMVPYQEHKGGQLVEKQRPISYAMQLRWSLSGNRIRTCVQTANMQDRFQLWWRRLFGGATGEAFDFEIVDTGGDVQLRDASNGEMLSRTGVMGQERQ